MKNFGKMTAVLETVDLETGPVQVYIFRDVDGNDLFDLATEYPHPFYIAVKDDGAIISMETSVDKIQIAGYNIIGIDQDFGYTNGPGGTVYGKIWDGSTIVDPALTPTPADVDQERDRRIDSGFSFGGVFYQTRPEDRENIAGASTAALAAIMNGAQPGDYRWHGGDTDFVWIAADNSTHAMDAQTLFAFGQAAMEHKQAHIFAARAIKDTDPIPSDFADDAYWP